VLWVVAVLIAALVAISFVRDGKPGPRDHVAAYIEKVNATSTSFSQDFAAVQQAYQSLALAPKASAKQVPALRRSLRKLHALRLRMQRIQPPPEAAALHTKLVAYFRQQEAVAAELLETAQYVPLLAAAERPLAAANATMRAALARETTGTGQAAALEDYAASVGHARARMEKLDPPPLFAVTTQSQIDKLARSERLVRRLATALEERDPVALNRAVRELGKPDAPSTAAARAAVVAYNRRVEKIARLGAAVQRERTRLSNDLD